MRYRHTDPMLPFWLLIILAASLITIRQTEADDYVVLNGVSDHQIEGEWNEENYGIGWERSLYYDDHKRTYSAGGYVDSNGGRAYYVGTGYEYRLGASPFYAGGTFQLTAREDLYDGYPGPMAYLSASYDGPVGINLIWVPSIVVGIQLKVEL